ncbi:hypothetical protein Ptr902_10866 [Pyrenophora tritici-repentis]|uniref:Uncharacterized protein n=1 Tax=Pyrenophora tritici-repentis TaxID=45151 RepID=A0A5M9KRW0_9PLEO|nr:hypothetical protein PtrV1_11851 [Pyrenophora tritici-repentis]KAF7564697.1 hypothetical protein PtrM4_041310 [Pyrenophora tritici-repentis]KAI0576664.1 hypothetical protein Alg130_08699 [Pyrenophora tritici-repentis]KAI0580328.1 hypothetical protein Alg215_05258 [Pyrenophora tritici-repentis]KAI0612567.1 hypothetical protein TUN205_03153 [Pyrenophora tritici-repentis]
MRSLLCHLLSLHVKEQGTSALRMSQTQDAGSPVTLELCIAVVIGNAKCSALSWSQVRRVRFANPMDCDGGSEGPQES